MSSGTNSTVRTPGEPSSWSRLPNDPGDPATEASEEGNGKHSSSELLEHTREHVGRAASRVGASLRRASEVLVAPGAGDVEGLLSSADLPELDSPDPLSSLSRRLDREADLWRSLTLRALARAGWADRFTQAIAVLAALGCVALAVVAAVSALFAPGSPGARSLLLLTGGLVLVAGSAVVVWAAAGVRRAQQVIAVRQLAPDRLPDALSRLEQDVSAPPG
jgi:hypothetical protein